MAQTQAKSENALLKRGVPLLEFTGTGTVKKPRVDDSDGFKSAFKPLEEYIQKEINIHTAMVDVLKSCLERGEEICKLLDSSSDSSNPSTSNGGSKIDGAGERDVKGDKAQSKDTEKSVQHAELHEKMQKMQDAITKLESKAIAQGAALVQQRTDAEADKEELMEEIKDLREDLDKKADKPFRPPTIKSKASCSTFKVSHEVSFQELRIDDVS